MLFKFREKPVHLDIFTDDLYVYEYFPIVKSSNNYPTWWKNIDKNIENPNIRGITSNSMKRCAGFLDLFKNSYIVPLWEELVFNIDSNNNVSHFSSSDSIHISSHPPYQRGDFLPENYYTHVKISTPWVARSNISLNYLSVSPTWYDSNFIDYFHVPPGIKDYYFTSSMNAHGILRKESGAYFILKAGTPLYHILPITEKKVKLNCHYDPEEVRKIDSLTSFNRFSHNHGYYKIKKYLKKNNIK